MYANFHLKLCKFDLWKKNWTKTIFLAKTDIFADLAKCEKSVWMYILLFSERSLSYSSITTEVLCKIIASAFAYETHSYFFTHFLAFLSLFHFYQILMHQNLKKFSLFFSYFLSLTFSFINFYENVILWPENADFDPKTE